MIKEEKAVKTVEYVSKVTMTCDICGKAVNCDAWVVNDRSVVGTKVRMWEDYNYPENVTYKITEFHICPECFMGRLKPWIEKFGSRVTVTEHD